MIAPIDQAFAAVYPNLVVTARTQLLQRDLDAQLAEDLVQDAFVRWLARGVKYRSDRHLYAWLRTTIKRLASEGLRRRDRLDMELSLDVPWLAAG